MPSGRRALAIVPGGGTGSRLGARVPKQYLAIHGAPVLVHTLRALGRARSLDGIVLVVPGARIESTRRLLARYRVRRVVAVVAGGAERQESVWNGLQVVPEEAGWVIVHDAVRPFLGADLVERVLEAARSAGAATCGMPVRETVKRVREATVQATLDRDGLWLVQTPQAFRRDLLWEAHDKARRDGYVGTDDAALVERLGARVVMVPGVPQNLKITTREDLRAAARWMRSPWAIQSRARGER
jgi:2-C-methyl-D-erythritol 4-phosphate cytidylyltransferase